MDSYTDSYKDSQTELSKHCYNIAVRFLCWDNYLTALSQQRLGFYRAQTIAVQREHRELAASAGEPAGEPRYRRGPIINSTSGPSQTAPHPFKTRGMEHLSLPSGLQSCRNGRFRGVSYSLHRLRRFGAPCSRSENSSAYSSSYIQQRHQMHTLQAHVIIAAQAAGIRARQLRFPHPVQPKHPGSYPCSLSMNYDIGISGASA